MKDFKKKLLYRSKYRGSREMDLILGKFAETFLDKMDDKELKDFEKILEQSDKDIYKWIVSREAPPATVNLGLIDKLRNFSIYE